MVAIKKKSLAQRFSDEEAKLAGVPTLHEIRSFRKAMDKAKAAFVRDNADIERTAKKMHRWLALAALFFIAGIAYDVIQLHWVNWAYVASGVISLALSLGEWLL
jgi:hypothetical protein